MNDWLVEAVHGLLWNCKATVYQASIQTIIQCLWFLNTIFLTRNSVTKKKKILLWALFHMYKFRMELGHRHI